MSNFQIKTNAPGTSATGHHFYMLNKGNNSGKPLDEACANCFRITLNSEKDRQFYYWLSYALWQADAFKPYLHGSCLQFLTIGHAGQILREAANRAQADRRKHLQSLQLLRDFERQSRIIEKQGQLIRQVKKAILHELII